MKCHSSILVFLLLTISFMNKAAAGDLKYKISGEGGVSRFAISTFAEDTYLLARFEGTLRYAQSARRNSWYIQGRLRPEIYFAESSPTAIIFNFKGAYLQRHAKFHWSVNVEAEKQRIAYDVVDITFDIFQLGGQGIWFYRPGAIFSMTINYAYRDLNSRLDHSLDAAFASVDWFPFFTLTKKISIGAYLENFHISRLQGFAITGNEFRNRGWRYGPEFSLEYQKKFVISGNYRFLLHQSDLTNATAYEHWVRLLLGRILSPKWSAFFLIDYFFRDYFLPEGVDSNLLYAPLNTQNNIYFKLEREMNPAADLFFRLGYLNENLIYQDLTFSGWRVTAGLEWSR